MTVSSFTIEDKNRISSLNVMLTLLEIYIPDEIGPPIHYHIVRIIDNNEQIEWNQCQWFPVPLEWTEILQSSKGEIPRVDFSISNRDRAMEYYIQAYDIYTKINGYTPIRVNLYVVNSGNLNISTPEVEYTFELQDIKSSSEWVTFTLGAASPYNDRFPRDRIMKNNGRVKKFKDIRCGYAGGGILCDRTLTTCRLYNNQTRFCGFPGVGNNSLKITR